MADKDAIPLLDSEQPESVERPKSFKVSEIIIIILIFVVLAVLIASIFVFNRLDQLESQQPTTTITPRIMPTATVAEDAFMGSLLIDKTLLTRSVNT